MIAQGAEMQTIIRLLCLASLTAGGIKAKSLENLKREMLQVLQYFAFTFTLLITNNKAYGYNFMPLLLSLAAPPLAILLPSPLPASTPPAVTSLKYPFASLRKSLRLLIDDSPEALDEVENDISFVYSGYAPISIRLIQCVAQKGGVLSNPAEKEKSMNDAPPQQNLSVGKVQAHPIMGWKGFEDVMTAIPGETVEILQTHPEDGVSGLPTPSSTSQFSSYFLI